MSLTLKNIPNDWELKKLKDVSEFSNGKGHEKSIDENGQYIVVNSKFVSTNGQVKKFSNQNLSPLKIGDITMVMSDIPNGKAIAKCFIIDEDNRYTLNQRICSIQSNEDCDNKFLYYVINRNRYYLAFDNGDSQTNLKKDEVLDCPVQFPPLPEQQKIAEILSTVDAKIEVIDQQITETEELKKGLMQRMLTKGIGHTEFKNSSLGEIPKSWEVVKLSDLSKVKGRIGYRGYTKSDLVNKGEGALTIGGSQISKQNKLNLLKPVYINWQKYEESPEIKIKEGDIVFAQRGTLGRAALIDSLPEPATINPSMVLIKNINCNKNYLFYFLCSNEVQKVVAKISSSTAVPMISQKQINNFKIALPPLTEQQKIAEVLKVVDEKRHVLWRKSKDFKHLKRGLMQKLLTGKIRVNNLVEA